MVRNYKKKTERGTVSEETMLLAVAEVNTSERSVRSVSEQFRIPRKTLGRYCTKFECTVSNEATEEATEDTTETHVLLPEEPNLLAPMEVKGVLETTTTEIATEINIDPPMIATDEDLPQNKTVNRLATNCSRAFSSFGYAKVSGKISLIG